MPITRFRRSKHRKFVEFLNAELPTSADIRLVEKPEFDCIRIHFPDGAEETVFAAYTPDEDSIMWPSGGEREVAYHALAHEYVHAWQNEKGLEFDEDEADKKADVMVRAFMKE